MSDVHELVLYIQDISFTTIFVVDIILKITALGPVSYMTQRWNQFDVVVVSAGLVSLFFPEAAFAKTMRVLRVFRLVKTSMHFRMLVSTILSAMGTIGEILAFEVAILLSYSFIGMCTFEGVKYGNVIGTYQNFDDFPNAFYSLIVVTFGEWVVLLKDLEIASPSCTVGQDCGNQAAGLYLMSFILLTTFVMTNLVVAAILSSFTWLYSMEDSRGNHAIGVDDLRKFKSVWQRFDVYSTGSMPHQHLKTFVEAVGEPVGRANVSTVWLRALQAEVAAIPGSNSGEVSFRNLFITLTTKMMGAGALCETLDGEIVTSSQEVTKLAAVQAVSKDHWENAKTKVNAVNALKSKEKENNAGRNLRRMSQVSLEEQIQRAKDAADAAAATDQEEKPGVQSRESLSLKDKVQVTLLDRISNALLVDQ